MDIKGPGYRIQPTLSLSLSLSLSFSLFFSLGTLDEHTEAVQRAICALNRNALWNNARDLAGDKGYYCCSRSVFSFVVCTVSRTGSNPFLVCPGRSVVPRPPIRFGNVCRTNCRRRRSTGCSLFRTRGKVVVKEDVAIFVPPVFLGVSGKCNSHVRVSLAA